MLRLLTAAVAVLALAGCATENEIISRICSDAGAPPGTSNYTACYMQVHAQRQENFRQMGAMGLQMMQNSQPKRNNITCVNNPPFTNCW